MKTILDIGASRKIIKSTPIIHEVQKKDWKTRNIKIKLERLKNRFGDGQPPKKL